MSQLNNALSEVNSQIKHYQEKLDESLDKFNDYYREISKELYNEEYIFSYEINDDDVFEFSATTMVGAVGAGKKKGQIAAFDLSYLKYLEKKQSSMCRFQVHDRLEEIHLNQLKAMFDIANGIDGQFVVPILRERIAGLGDQFIKDNMVVSLADDDKFFRI